MQLGNSSNKAETEKEIIVIDFAPIANHPQSPISYNFYISPNNVFGSSTIPPSGFPSIQAQNPSPFIGMPSTNGLSGVIPICKHDIGTSAHGRKYERTLHLGIGTFRDLRIFHFSSPRNHIYECVYFTQLHRFE